MVAVSILGESKVGGRTALHHHLDRFDAGSVGDAKAQAESLFRTKSPGAKILSVLVEVMP